MSDMIYTVSSHEVHKTRTYLLNNIQGKDPETAQFLDCYRELSKQAQLELAAFIVRLPGGASVGGAILFRLVQKGHL